MFIGIAYKERSSQWKGIDLRLLWKNEWARYEKATRGGIKRIKGLALKKKNISFSEIRGKKMTKGLIILEVKDRIWRNLSLMVFFSFFSVKYKTILAEGEGAKDSENRKGS